MIGMLCRAQTIKPLTPTCQVGVVNSMHAWHVGIGDSTPSWTSDDG